MPKKKTKVKAIQSMDNTELLELIDDQIYKHLPISKITEMINEAVKKHENRINSYLEKMGYDIKNGNIKIKRSAA